MAAPAASLFRHNLAPCIRKWARRIARKSSFSRAVAFQSRGLIPEALFDYGRAAEGGDPQMRRVALIEKARLATRYAALPL